MFPFFDQNITSVEFFKITYFICVHPKMRKKLTQKSKRGLRSD